MNKELIMALDALEKENGIDKEIMFAAIEKSLMDEYKAEFDKKRAEVRDDSAAQILANMQTIADILKKPEQNRSIADFERNGDHEQTGTAE